MQPYIELNAHHIGNSHVQSGMSCEDYSATYSDDQVSIIVISDGHGDKNCFRSDRGARYACETAINLCRQFQSITNHIDDIAQCDFESLIVSLESDLADAWKEKALADVTAHPFSTEEMSVASKQAQEVYRSGQRLEKAYGCTLILAMSTANYWLSIQIGDGKSIAAYRDGVFVEPVPADENCLGNRSTSLCNSNAKGSFRHYYSKVKPIAAFVSSDGVEESFDQAGLYNFFYSIAYWLKEEGFDTAKAKVEGLLPQISEGGSGDDVSVAVMVSKEDAIAKPRQTLEQIYERVTACENVLNQVKNLLADTKDRLSEKDKESTSLEKEIAKLKAELEEKESAHKKTIAEQEALQRSVDELDAKAQRAAEQMDKASKYKASAERYWFAEFEKIGLKYQPPVEAVEVNYLQDNAENQKEAAEDSSNVVDDSSSHVDASEATVIATGEKNPIDQIEHIDDTALATQPEPDYPGAYNDVKREPTQEQPLVEVKEKTAKHFWPFSKQSR